MKVFAARLLVLLLFVSCLFVPAMGAHAQAISADQLKEAVEKVIEEGKLGNPQLGILIQDAESGRILYEQNPDLPLKPASNNKIRTGVTAMALLGPDFRYVTPIIIRGEVKGKTLHGDVIVRGSGDPSISGRYAKDKSDLTWVLREWAHAVKARGIKEVTGRVIGDDDYFDDDYFGKGWHEDSRSEWYSAEVSALSFNDNCIDILWKGGKKSGTAAKWELVPKTDYIKFLSEVKTGEKNTGRNTTFSRKDKTNVIVAKGTVSSGTTTRDFTAIYNPTHYTATIFRDMMIKEGIKVKGGALDLDDDPKLKQEIQDDESTTTVLEWESPTLMTLMEAVNTNSQNLFTELMLKTLGKKIKGEGSFSSGTGVVMDFMRENGMAVNGAVMIDGSGLSHLNRTTATQLVKMLDYARRQPWWIGYRDSMTRGGEKGTLKNSYDDNPEMKKTGSRIYGKSGFIGGVVSLTGVVVNEEGRDIFYSVLINGYSCPVGTARKTAAMIAYEAARSRIP